MFTTIEQQMLERGYLDSREMSNMFNLLRSNDLIWSNEIHIRFTKEHRRVAHLGEVLKRDNEGSLAHPQDHG